MIDDSGKTKTQLLEEVESLRSRLMEFKFDPAAPAQLQPTAPTHDKRAPGETAELEHLYRTAPVGLCLLNTDLRFVRINERLAAINGRPISEHLGRTLREVIPDLAPQGEPIYRQVIETGMPVLDYEVHGTTSASSHQVEAWVVSHYPVESPDGTVIGVSTVVQDITERKRIEEELRQAHNKLERRVYARTTELQAANDSLRREIAERKRAEAALRQSERQSREQLAELEALYQTAPLGLCHTDTDLRYLRCNERLAETNGIPAADHIGRALREIVPEIADTMEPIYRKVIQSGQPVMNLVATGTTAADPKTTRHFSACYYPVKSEDGVVQGVSSIVQEITQLKREEEDRRRLQDELAHLSRVGTLGEMAATLAHELNQPLTAICNYASGSLNILQSTEADSPDLREALEHIRRLTRRAGQIIHRIRGLVRKGKPHRSSVPPNDLIREVVELVEFEAQAKAVKIELDLAGELPLVPVDRIQIQQVIVNLVRNAFDAMSEIDQRTRKLLIQTRSAPVGTVEIIVSDTGKGLPEGVAVEIFEAFYTTKSDGLGLGLGISRSIIEVHGGRLWTEPQTEGATFRFTLPVVPVAVPSN